MKALAIQFIHIFLCPVFTLAATVNLNAPKYIRRDDFIHVTCSSDEKPIFSMANFYINGIAYTSLRREEYGCYSARVKCPLNSLTCYCSRDGKQYGLLIRSPVKALIMTVSCKMRFLKNGQTVLKSDDLIVQIHDPPFLSLDHFVACNTSSFVQIQCNSNANIGSFGDWVHSYTGTFLRSLPGIELNNTSTIFIDNCDVKDMGEYTCKAWNKLDNETYWSNVTTHLAVYGPPKILWIKSSQKHENPLSFSVSFYSRQTPTYVHWTRDYIPVENFTGLVVKLYEKNITFNMYGKPLVHIGHVTSLTVNERSTSVYSFRLKNEFGDYSHQFPVLAGTEDYFSLRTVVWILICMAVFLFTVTMATVLLNRRSRTYLKRFENAGAVAIYYAAPSTVYNVSPYAATTMEYEEYEEPINVSQEETRSRLQRGNHETRELEEDNETNHYIEVF